MGRKYRGMWREMGGWGERYEDNCLGMIREIYLRTFTEIWRYLDMYQTRWGEIGG